MNTNNEVKVARALEWSLLNSKFQKSHLQLQCPNFAWRLLKNLSIHRLCPPNTSGCLLFKYKTAQFTEQTYTAWLPSAQPLLWKWLEMQSLKDTVQTMSIGKFVWKLCECWAEHLLKLTTRRFEPLMFSRQGDAGKHLWSYFGFYHRVSSQLDGFGRNPKERDLKGVLVSCLKLHPTSAPSTQNDWGTAAVSHFEPSPSVASKAEPRCPAKEFISSFTPDTFTSSEFFTLWLHLFYCAIDFQQKK